VFVIDFGLPATAARCAIRVGGSCTTDWLIDIARDRTIWSSLP